MFLTNFVAITMVALTISVSAFAKESTTCEQQAKKAGEFILKANDEHFEKVWLELPAKTEKYTVTYSVYGMSDDKVSTNFYLVTLVTGPGECALRSLQMDLSH